jgi:hypothetical protein
LATAERHASFAVFRRSRPLALRVERIRIGCVHAKGAASQDTTAAAIILWRTTMPEKRTIKKAREDKRAGKSPGTQAGEFVREEIHKIRRGEHGARSPRQAIAIGLSEARRAGVDLPPPKKGKVKARTRKSAEYAYEAGQGKRRTRRRPRVSRAVLQALKREPRNTASRGALSRQARSAAARRSRSERSAAARKAGRTKGSAGRSAAARKGARTRARRPR